MDEETKKKECTWTIFELDFLENEGFNEQNFILSFRKKKYLITYSVASPVIHYLRHPVHLFTLVFEIVMFFISYATKAKILTAVIC